MKIPEMFKMCLGLSSSFIKYSVSSGLMRKVIRSLSLVFGESSVGNNQKRITKTLLQKTAKTLYL